MDPFTEYSTISGIPPEAFAQAVFNRYAQRLLVVARQRLGVRLRTKVSEEDVVQSAFRSFFRRKDEFEFANDSSDGLWGLLVVITVRKCAKWADHFHAGKRSLDQEVAIDEADSRAAWMDIAAREPGPEEAALLSELVERLMQPLDSRRQQIVSLRMQGFELEEIAHQTHSSRRTVARVIAEAKEMLRQLMMQDQSGISGT